MMKGLLLFDPTFLKLVYLTLLTIKTARIAMPASNAQL